MIAGLVLEGDEDGLAVARPLAHQHDAGRAARSRRRGSHRGLRAGSDALACEDRRAGSPSGGPSATGAASGSRPRHARRAAWPAARASGSAPSSRASAAANSGSGASSGQAAHGPERLAPVEPHRAEGVGLGERAQRPCAAAAAGSQTSSTSPIARRRGARRCAAPSSSLKPSICRKPSRSASAPVLVALQRVVPDAVVDVDGPHLDAVLAARRARSGPARRSPSAAN